MPRMSLLTLAVLGFLLALFMAVSGCSPQSTITVPGDLDFDFQAESDKDKDKDGAEQSDADGDAVEQGDTDGEIAPSDGDLEGEGAENEHETPEGDREMLDGEHNAPPVLVLTGTPEKPDYETTYTANHEPIPLLNVNGATLTDPDSETLAHITLTFDKRPDAEDEGLRIILTENSPLSFAPDPTKADTWLLQGPGTPAQYLTALKGIAYFNLASRITKGDRVITFLVSDGVSESKPVYATIAVMEFNSPPTITLPGPQTIAEDGVLGPLAFTVSDLETPSSQLTVEVSSDHPELISPAKITTSGTGGNRSLVAHPEPNANGSLLLTVRVLDGDKTTSGTLPVTITPVNDPPTSADQAFTLDKNTSLSFTLEASDVEDSDPGVIIVGTPAHGSLQAGVKARDFTYTPVAKYSGTDSFTFKVVDSQLAESPVYTTQLTIHTNNVAPVTRDLSLTLAEDGTLLITLPGTDDDGDPLSAQITAPPANGSLLHSASGELDYIYTPKAEFFGSDSFSYVILDDKGGRSVQGTANLTVTAVNDPPTTASLSLSTNEDTPLTIPFTGNDVDSTTVSVIIVDAPSHGTLTPTADPLLWTYTPAADFNGTDTFTFKVRDDQNAESALTSAAIVIRSVNDAPKCAPLSLTTTEDKAITFTLSCTDTEGDAITGIIAISPGHGVLVTGSGTLSFIYTPALNYNGDDSFSFRARDSKGAESSITNASVTITAVNDPPTARSLSLSADEDVPLAITFIGSDPEGSTLQVVIVGSPSHGTLTPTADPMFYTYTPTADYSGADNFTFKVRDAQNLDSEVTSAGITIRPVNDAPRCTAMTLSTAEDTPLSITLSCTDIEGNAMTPTIVASPQHGTLVAGSSALAFVYTPATNYNGSDSFTFKVRDSLGAESSVVSASLTVTAANDPPTTSALTLSTDEDVPLAITFTGSDPEGSTLQVVIVGSPSHGTLTPTADPMVYTYTPTADYNGADNFTFKVRDAQNLDSAVTSASITIRPVNDAPRCTAMTLSTAEDTPLSITLSCTDIEGNAMTPTIVASPQHGTLVAGSSALAFVYTPATNYNGSDSFTFKVRDSLGAESSVVSASLTVTAANDPPTTSNISFTTNEDTAYSFTFSGTDPEGNAMNVMFVTTPIHGQFSATANPRVYLYTPSSDYNGTDSFSFKITDVGGASSALATGSITITPVNDAPVARAVTVTTAEDTALTFDLSASDIENDPLTVQLISSPAHGGLAIVGSSGTTLTYTYTPAANYNGSDSFVYTVMDSHGLISGQATVTIIITPVNDPPTTSQITVTTNEDTDATVTFTGSDAEGSALHVEFVTAPQHGTLSSTANPMVYTYIPNYNYNGQDSFTFVIRDMEGASSATTAGKCTIIAVNDAPVASGSSVSVNKNDTTEISVSATDIEGDSLTATIQTTAAHGTLVAGSSGLAFRYTPTGGYYGSDSFTFTVKDPSGAESNSATVTITVLNTQSAPTIATIPAKTVLEDTTIDPIPLTIADSDTPISDLIVTASSNKTTLVTAAISGTTSRNLELTLIPNAYGTATITVAVSDGTTTINTSFILTVTNVNDAPTALTMSKSTNEDTSLSLMLSYTDIDSTTLTGTIVTGPAYGQLVMVTGNSLAYTYKPTANYNGPDTFTFKVTDSDGLVSNVATCSITVVSVNDSPVATSASYTVDENTAYTITLSGTDIDTPSSSLQYYVVSGYGPSHGTLSGSGATRIYTPATDYNGTDSFYFYVNDGNSNSSNAIISITVRNVNQPPKADTMCDVVTRNTSYTIVLKGHDPDNNEAVTGTIVSFPTHGTLIQSTDSLHYIYTPVTGYYGNDSYTFKLTDPWGLASTVAEGSIVIY